MICQLAGRQLVTHYFDYRQRYFFIFSASDCLVLVISIHDIFIFSPDCSIMTDYFHIDTIVSRPTSSLSNYSLSSFHTHDALRFLSFSEVSNNASSRVKFTILFFPSLKFLYIRRFSLFSISRWEFFDFGIFHHFRIGSAFQKYWRHIRYQYIRLSVWWRFDFVI